MIDSALFQVTTPWPAAHPPRGGQADVAQPRAQHRRLVDAARRTRGGRGRRRGSASRGRGTGRAARPGGSAPAARAQSSGAGGQPNVPPGVGPARAGPSTARPPRRTTSRATAGSRVVDAGAEPGDLGLPVARPRRVDGRELGAQRGDEVPVGARHPDPVAPLRPSGRARAALGRRRWPPSRSQAPMIAAASRTGSWWWALSGSTTSSSTSRGPPGSRAGGQRSRTGWPSQPVGACGVEPVVREDDVGQVARAVARERVEVVGEVEAARLAGLRGHVAREHDERAGRRDRLADPGHERARAGGS